MTLLYRLSVRRAPTPIARRDHETWDPRKASPRPIHPPERSKPVGDLGVTIDEKSLDDRPVPWLYRDVDHRPIVERFSGLLPAHLQGGPPDGAENAGQSEDDCRHHFRSLLTDTSDQAFSAPEILSYRDCSDNRSIRCDAPALLYAKEIVAPISKISGRGAAFYEPSTATARTGGRPSSSRRHIHRPRLAV